MPGRSRHAFLGGNTPSGFYSYFHHLAEPRRTRRMFVLKGGPGTGKSSFMRHVAERARAAGYDVELFHCSSDPGSLDAVRIPALEIAWVDGTAPHVLDPALPGLVGEIVDLGAHLDPGALADRKDEILALQAEVAAGFEAAFRYLRAARCALKNVAAANRRSLSLGGLNERTHSLITSLFGHRQPSDVPGRTRHLFAAAVTPDGLVHYLPTLVDGLPRQVIITGEPGTGRSTLLSAVAQAAVAHGFDVELYHSPLEPRAVDHVIIPGLGAGLVSSVPPHEYDAPGALRINLNECRDYDAVKRSEQLRREAWELHRRAVDLAVATLARTKEVRGVLEAIYTAAMDFAPVEALREEHAALITTL